MINWYEFHNPAKLQDYLLKDYTEHISLNGMNISKNTWLDFIKNEMQQDYFQLLLSKIITIIKTNNNKINPILPKPNLVFNALKLTNINNIKVVIIGQDPYPNPEFAMGLSFSSLSQINLPKSMQNIYRELYNDIGIDNINSANKLRGDLTSWAEQGVLLLNNVLTVTAHNPNSHQNFGWEIFTERLLYKLVSEKEKLIFVLWGKQAQDNFKKAVPDSKLTTQRKHFVIASAHPSPLSAHRGFFKSNPFSKINGFLLNNAIRPINWQL